MDKKILQLRALAAKHEALSKQYKRAENMLIQEFIAKTKQLKTFELAWLQNDSKLIKG
jgi:hypothetical protein